LVKALIAEASTVLEDKPLAGGNRWTAGEVASLSESDGQRGVVMSGIEAFGRVPSCSEGCVMRGKTKDDSQRATIGVVFGMTALQRNKLTAWRYGDLTVVIAHEKYFKDFLLMSVRERQSQELC
jgi:hypothetical protein